jgi:hypothetical protein
MCDTDKLTSNDIKPGPFSEHELREQWNSQADEFNQWDSLDSCEQLAWAQTQALSSSVVQSHALPAEGGVASDRISSEQWTQKALKAMEQLISLREHMIFIRDNTPKTPALSRNRWDKGSKAAHKERQAQIGNLYNAISIIHSMLVARPLESWNDDDGVVLWWVFPIQEPPYVGSPLDSKWPGYHTHWTPLPPFPLDPDGVLPAVEDSQS